jgi:predicted nucleotidyltransferase
MLENLPDRVKKFIEVADKNNLEMILVGGGAVNFHGYQRHSADIDFWINITSENMQNLLKTIQNLGYDIHEIPDQVLKKQQNISIKISPVFELELITNFNPGKSFDEALSTSEKVEKDGLNYHVLSFNDLIQSKITSPRPKDKLDVAELQRIRMKKK